ncbi:MAG TPA: hypothetical protein VGE01_04040 [Fimbriimonas sp.]
MPSLDRAFGLLLLGAAVLAGCQSPTLPDPNDPNDVTVVQPQVLRASLRGAAEALNERLEKGEIDQQRYDQLMAEYAEDLLGQTKIERIPHGQAWEYAEIFRTAQRWQDAEKVLRIAVKAAKNEDRRVNDSLRLAHALAQLNKVPEALEVARSTFDTPAQEKAPILTAVLLEIVPAAKGKGSDMELARLLEDAIGQADQTIVDPDTQPGSAFIAARPHHIRNAWRTVVDLYRAVGREDLAAEAIRREEEASRRGNTI